MSIKPTMSMFANMTDYKEALAKWEQESKIVKTTKTAVSSPMRFEKVQGLFVVTCLNLQDKKTKEHLGSMHQAESRSSFSHAKKVFWETWKEEMPDYFLVPRHDA